MGRTSSQRGRPCVYVKWDNHSLGEGSAWADMLTVIHDVPLHQPNPTRNKVHSCDNCVNFTGKTCIVCQNVILDYGKQTYESWIENLTAANFCSYWQYASAERSHWVNPLTAQERDLLEDKLEEHLDDGLKHRSPIGRTFDYGVAAGIEEALKNPRHPYQYDGHMQSYDSSRSVRGYNPRMIAAWGTKWGFKLTKQDVYDVMKDARIGGYRQWNKGPCTLTIIKHLRTEENPRDPRQNNFKSAKEYWQYLQDTLIPALQEMGSGFAKDFLGIVNLLRTHFTPAQYNKNLRRWAPYIRHLAAEARRAGLLETAKDLDEGLFWLGQRVPNLRNPYSAFKNPISSDGLHRISEWASEIAGTSRRGTEAIEQVLHTERPDLLGPQEQYSSDEKPPRPPWAHKNPLQAPVEGAKLIGEHVLAMEYLDTPKAKREGVENPSKPWRHDFEVKGTKIWGLPDGRVLLDGPKPLWRSQPNSVTGK